MLASRQLISIILLLVGIGFIAALMIGSWHQILVLLAEADWALLGLSCLAGMSSMLVISVFFRFLLIKHSLHLPARDVHRLFFYGQIAKYVPGKVWGILYQVASVNRRGASQGLAAANLDLMVVSLLANFSGGLALLAVQFNVALAVVVFVLGLCVTIFASRSSISARLIAWLASKLGREGLPVGGNAKEGVGQLASVACFYLLLFFTSVLAYYLMMKAVFSFGFGEVVAYIGYLILAWVAGVFLFLAPAGMGVRELVFIVFGSQVDPGVSTDMLVAIALLARFWQVIQELGAAVIVFICSRLCGK